MRFDSVRIQVPNLAQAARQYELLLGIPAHVVDRGTRRYQLGRGAVELIEGRPGLHSLCFTETPGTDGPPWPVGADAFHGLCVRTGPAADIVAPNAAIDAARAIDHVVAHSPNLDRAVALWRDRLGLRLALDREFPARGLRILFFRSGGVTLEFVGASPPVNGADPDRLYGIAYQVQDLRACCARLSQNCIDVSAIRPGHKAGTSVATVRSGTLEIPTLLLCADSRPR